LNRKTTGLIIGSKTIRAFCAGSSKRAPARVQGLEFRLEDIEE